MKNNISDYLKELTKEFSKDNLKLFSANSIAEKINLSRSTVSSYLNKEVKNGSLIKVKEYPVIFLDRDVFCSMHYEVKLNEYESLEQLFDEDEKGIYKKDVLNSIIGAKGSLKEQIEQIKTASLYPNNGLPIMLLGPSGSGKTYLAECIYNYCVREKLINEKSKFISLNCAQYYHNPELLSSLLFGYVKGAFTGADSDKKGLLENADGGVLFLDEVHRLSEEGQEKLFTFMDSGEYSPIGDNSIKKKAQVRLIFATTESIQSTFLPTFIRRLPVIVSIPSFAERPQQEKLNLIDSFFLKESKILKRVIKVSKQVISFLLSSNYEGNVGKIKNLVKYSCGSSYARMKNDEVIKVKVTDLPIKNGERIKDSYNLAGSYQDRMYDFNHPEILNISSKEQKNIAATYFQFIEEFKHLERNGITSDLFINKMMSNVNILLDDLLFNTNGFVKNQSLFSILTFNIRYTFKYVEENYGLKQDGNKILSIASLLYFKEENEILVNHPDWNSIKSKLLSFIGTYMEDALWLAKLILGNLSEQLDYEFLDEDLIFITFYLNSTKMSKINSKINSIVLAHGYSTASSIANVANRMLQKNLFQAIDMPIDTTIDDIENRVIEFIDNYNTENGLILLVDMGSLSDLSNRLKDKIKGPILIIDYVSTPLVLEIGGLLLQEKDINEISELILKDIKINKKLVYPTRKSKKAILTCCYTGLGSAVQIQDILNKSLSETNNSFTIIPYDYHKLQQNKQRELPFQVYDVLAIVGTANPNVEGVKYIGLDKLINGEEIEEFIGILKQNFEVDGDKLKKDLVFNFSMKKIIENLTILDATKILKSIEKAVDRVEDKLDINISNNKRFLLYLHCSCMIERILRRERLDEQEDIQEFLRKEKENVEIIRYSFFEVEKEYNIKVPDLEIRLICDIVFNG